MLLHGWDVLGAHQSNRNAGAVKANRSSGESHQSTPVTMIGSGANKGQGTAKPGDKRAVPRVSRRELQWRNGGGKGLAPSRDSVPFSYCSLCL